MQNTQNAGVAFFQPDPEQIAHNRRSLWLASLIVLAGLLAFVALFNFVFPDLGNQLGDLSLIGLGLLMSLLPAGLWLVFFHRLDRIEPEPKQKLLGIFVLGALVAAAVGQPLLARFFRIDDWLYASGVTQLLGGILLVGFVQEFVVYLVVRYGIYSDPEFDERVDGVIYAVAAGLGLATVLNFNYVIDHGGVDLDIGSVRMVVNALAHASFAGVLGYCLGQARFEKTPPAYLPTGLAIAALLNGLFFFLEDQVTAAGFQVNPWYGLLLATIVAGLTLLVVFWLVNRANEETLRLAWAQRRDEVATAAGTWLGERDSFPAEQAATAEVAGDVEGGDETVDDGPIDDDEIGGQKEER